MLEPSQCSFTTKLRLLGRSCVENGTIGNWNYLRGRGQQNRSRKTRISQGMQVPSSILQNLAKLIHGGHEGSNLMVHEAGTEAETQCIVIMSP
jgi:hypothetical protein